MVLTVDIGNSNIVLGGYRDGASRFNTRIATDLRLEAVEYALKIRGILDLQDIPTEAIDGIAIASVVPALTQVLIRAFAHLSALTPFVLTIDDAKDVHVKSDNHAELGMDILASAIAVQHTKPLPAVIIDMGTATKVIAVDKDANLLGVAISPGLFVSLEALLHNASLLQGIPLEAPAHAIGRNTPESIKSGVVLGTASMLDGMIDRFDDELGGIATLVSTGGVSRLVIPHCTHKIEHNDTLLLDGLYHAFMRRED